MVAVEDFAAEVEDGGDESESLKLNELVGSRCGIGSLLMTYAMPPTRF